MVLAFLLPLRISPYKITRMTSHASHKGFVHFSPLVIYIVLLIYFIIFNDGDRRIILPAEIKTQ
ncbi:hypothetical protein HBA_0727 [Sodalis endosymbiont of Henestaris halophilus]|nr:hypothetical protein HBA_0727 [Sodalis endosymbiont of Henestaris halophilus]